MLTTLPPNPPAILAQAYNLQPSDVAPITPFKGLRAQAQGEAAYSIGVQAGVSWRYQQIDFLLWGQSPVLDQLYDFTPMMLDEGKVLPPIVTMGESNFELKNDDEAQAGLVTWHIVAPARIVTLVPSWNGYLIQNFTVDFQSVNAALLPQNQKELDLWHATVLRGWQDGITQADRLYRIALATLNRDFLGVARFHMLAREGMVSMPALATGDLGVVVDRNTMVVGARVYRIVEDAQWQKPKTWIARPGS